eukprot:7302310-Prymnesium_polylepis.2
MLRRLRARVASRPGGWTRAGRVSQQHHGAAAGSRWCRARVAGDERASPPHTVCHTFSQVDLECMWINNSTVSVCEHARPGDLDAVGPACASGAAGGTGAQAGRPGLALSSM